MTVSQTVDPAHVTIVVELRARPETVVEAEREVTAFAEENTLDGASLAISFYRDPADPAHFLLVETFASQAAVEAHLAGPRLGAFFGRVQGLLDGQPASHPWKLQLDLRGAESPRAR